MCQLIILAIWQTAFLPLKTFWLDSDNDGRATLFCTTLIHRHKIARIRASLNHAATCFRCASAGASYDYARRTSLFAADREPIDVHPKQVVRLRVQSESSPRVTESPRVGDRGFGPAVAINIGDDKVAKQPA